MHNDVDTNDVDYVVEKNKKSPLLSRIRTFGNHLAISSISSALSSSLSAVFQENQKISDPAPDIEALRALTGYDPDNLDPFAAAFDSNRESAFETSTPTQTRSNSPINPTRIADVGKRIFTTFTRSRAGSTAKKPTADWNNDGNGVELADLTQGPNIHNPEKHVSHYFAADFLPVVVTTPPLTPDTFSENSPSPVVLEEYEGEVDEISEWHVKPFDQVEDEDELNEIMEAARARNQSFEVREGKKPDRSLSVGVEKPGRGILPAPQIDDHEEWFGLEYTLELSSRERSPSEAQPSSPGEHSKSHKSWAALHRGTMHPFFEDEDYYQWKNWHRYLDRQDERKKYRKAFEFKARSKDLALFYVDEMRTRKVMYWQKEVYDAVTRDIKERLDILSEQCPDPYVPRHRHGLAWSLKLSRSVSCLRELQSSRFP